MPWHLPFPSSSRLTYPLGHGPATTLANLSSIEPAINFARQTLGDLRGLWSSKFFLLPPVLPPTSFPNDRELVEQSLRDLKATVQDIGQQLREFQSVQGQRGHQRVQQRLHQARTIAERA